MKCAKTFNLVHVKFISRAQGLRNHQQTKKRECKVSTSQNLQT